MNPSSALREQIVSILSANPASIRDPHFLAKGIQQVDLLKSQIHREILSEMDLRAMEGVPAETIKEELKA